MHHPTHPFDPDDFGDADAELEAIEPLYQSPGLTVRPLTAEQARRLVEQWTCDPATRPRAYTTTPPPNLSGPDGPAQPGGTHGRPGASAHAQYQRRRATELATWARGLPWRILALVVAGVAAWLAAARVAPDLAAPTGVTVAAGLGWLLRFRSSPDAVAWRRGAAGERRTARLLAPLERRSWAVLHDLAIPGSAANIDHLVIGPGGVLVIDSKQYRGQLHVGRDGMVWHGRHLLVSALRKTLWEADQADEVLGITDIQVAAIVAVHGASIPRGVLRADGVTIVPARRLPDLLQALPPVFGPERVAWLADRARLRFRPAA
jgi:hypothetical protein